MKIKNIWKAIDNGLEVNWGSTYYHVIIVKSELNNSSKLSHRNDTALRVTCKENYFGSLICESDLKDCFIKK